jgi:hypothetical protein
MEQELLRYRANPTNANFNTVYRRALPWLRNVSSAVIRRYRNLSVTSDMEDLVTEGALSMSRAAVRFVYMCPVCPEVHLYRRDVAAHLRRDHRLRGAAYVGLETFAQCSARLAIKRTARRLLTPDMDEVEEATAVDAGVEADVLLNLLVSAARVRMTDGAVTLLREILTDPDPREIRGSGPAVMELRRRFVSLQLG